ncbi:DUF7065 domain-containing protein [Nocardia alni]|uniref:DUF7065 domain-containing protein n=1 Tax=Nocardia alni TaxID=2815723 RepID=UPI001C238742|nr:hypothetical protein [Nocardia alni]
MGEPGTSRDEQAAYFSVTAADEGMHDPGPEGQWNESAFVHVVEEDGRAGALFRIGRRVNEGLAEVTALHLRDGRDAFVGFERAPITGNGGWAAGSLDFRAAEGWSVRFDGTLSHLPDGELFLDPGRAMRECPRVPARFELTAVDLVPPYRTTTDGTYHGGAAIAKDHYAGVARVSGSAVIDGRKREVRGFGFRDHSWGVRDWQAVDCWRWIYGQLDAENLFSVVVMYPSGGEPDVAGIALRGGRPFIVTEASVTCRYAGPPDHWVDAVEIVVPHPGGAIMASFQPTCRLPLRHRKGGEVLRIVEHLARVTFDGRPGAGWFETTDRMEAGRPFGLTRGI